MPKKAILLDFYGTVVHEDEVYVNKICHDIAKACENPPLIDEIESFWWDIYHSLCTTSSGKRFINRKQIMLMALKKTIRYFDSEENPEKLIQLIYHHWQAPEIFEDAKTFFAKVPVPVCIVSNSDRDDIQSAIIHHELLPETFVTSQDVKCYKPDSIIFQHALNCISLTKNDVIVIGDSISCDVVGAKKTDIDVIWMNRKNKPISPYLDPDMVCNNLLEVLEKDLF